MVLGLAASVLVLAAAASPAPSGAARPEIAAGVRQLEAGDFEGALASFQAAVGTLRAAGAPAADLALAYHYLGVASLGISEELRARTEFLQRMRGGPGPHREDLPELTPERRPTGRLQVVVRPWAEVTIDGVDVGLTPMGRLRLAPGRHVVRVTHPAFEELEKPVTVAAGETAKLVVDLTSEGVRRRP